MLLQNSSRKSDKEGSVSTFLKGLFGASFLKKEATKDEKPVNQPNNKSRGSIKVGVGLSSSDDEVSPKKPVKPAYEDFDDEDIARIRPRKTIYNYLMEGDLEDNNANSAKKSILFMKEFFKD